MSVQVGMATGSNTELYWEQLLQFLEEGRVVPIVGRELLQVHVGGAKQDLYVLLAERLAAKLGVSSKQLSAAEPLHDVACRYLDGGGELEFVYAVLKSVMPPPEELPIPQPLLQLAGIDAFKLYVTTTFDPLLARALDEVRHGGQRQTRVLSFSHGGGEDLPCGAASLRRPTVYHLLGRLSAVPDYVLTEEDTLEFVHELQSRTGRPQRLFHELARHYLLIVGSRFSGWLARFFIRVVKPQRLFAARGKLDFVADEVAGNDAALLEFLRRFSSRTKFFEQGAIDFVEELARRWAEHRARQPATALPTAPALPERKPGAVFISYAHEDLSAAQEIRAALEEVKIDTWMDERRLEPGEDYWRTIKQRVEDCSFFLAVVSRHALTPGRRFFRREWSHAESVAAWYPSNYKFIVPVVIDDTPPDAEELPEGIRKGHWLGLAGGLPTLEFVETMQRKYRQHQKLGQPGL